MPTINDLPLPGIQLVSRHARGQIINGVNRYACVCRRWRDADDSGEGDLLQLFADLRHMSDQDITRALQWMATHGQQVEVLSLRASMGQPLPVDLFSRAAPSLSSLTWLEVAQRHSRVVLAPLLGQLPQLQHLVAAVDLGLVPLPPDVNEEEEEEGEDDARYPAMFLDQSGKRWGEVPDLQQLCPQLVQLHLMLDAEGGEYVIDGRLPQLVPPRTQELTLESTQEAPLRGCVRGEAFAMLETGSLAHATGLRQLTLYSVELLPAADQLASPVLERLQQLRVVFAGQHLHRHLMLQLAPKVTAYRHVGSSWGAEPQMVHLTQLVLSWASDTSIPEGITAAIAGLTGLQQLSLEGGLGGEGRPLESVLEQVAGMSALRSLQLQGSLQAEEAPMPCDGLAHCTQLTALTLLVRAQDSHPQGDDGCIHVLQQLTRLCRLAVPSAVVVHAAGAWLASLSHLTCLCVQLPRASSEWDYPRAVVEGLVCQVQGWPALMQQATRAVMQSPDSAGSGPALWQFTPAVPGATLVHLWVEEEDWAAHGWSQPLKPCPHLPGVWQLQGRPQGSCWVKDRHMLTAY